MDGGTADMPGDPGNKDEYYRLDGAYAPLAELLGDTSVLAERMLGGISISGGKPVEVITACLFIKMTNTLRALRLLMDRSLMAESYVLLRHYIEALFVLKAAVEDGDFMKDYIGSDSLYRLKLGNVIARNPELFGKEDIKEVERTRDELREVVSAGGVKELTMKDLAGRAGLLDFFNTAYGVLSNITHLGVRSLDDYIEADAEGNITGLNPLPYQDKAPLIFVTTVEASVIAFGCVDGLFNAGMKEEIDELGRRLHALAGEFGF